MTADDDDRRHADLAKVAVQLSAAAFEIAFLLGHRRRRRRRRLADSGSGRLDLDDQLDLDRGVQRQHGDPTALRACTPASPKTWPSSSLAPLMTPGWPVKSGALATNPTTFTTRRTSRGRRLAT